MEVKKEEIKTRIKNYQVPMCDKGDFHEALNQVCIDKRCEQSKQLQTLCSGCIEDKLHSSTANHQQRLLKKVLWEIVQEIDGSAASLSNFEELIQKLQELSNDFSSIGEACYSKQYEIDQKIKTIKEISAKESIVKEKLMETLDCLLKNSQIEQIEQGLKELRSNLKFNHLDKIVVNNDAFDEEWKNVTLMVHQINKGCSQLIQNLKNTGLCDFDIENPLLVGKVIMQQPQVQAQSANKQFQVGNSQSVSILQKQQNKLQTDDKLKKEEKIIVSGGFSPINKGLTFEIIQNKKIRQTISSNNDNCVALIEPALALDKKIFYAFEIVQQIGWIGLGVARKSVVSQNNYGFSFEDSNHGQYLVSQNGYKWAHNNPKDDGQKVNFSFEQGSIVLCEFDPQQRRVRYKKKGSDKMAQVNLDITEKDCDDFYMCVNIREKDDSISIYNDKK